MELKRYMKANKLSQMELARIAGVSQKTVGRALMGDIGRKGAIRIAAATCGAVSAAEILGLKTNPQHTLSLDGVPDRFHPVLRTMTSMLREIARSDDGENAVHPPTVAAAG